ncbi:MAG: endonuclease NucS, partial [Candidatus Nanohalobium sp.]
MEKIVKNPSFEQAEEILDEYLKRNYTVQVNGLCMVNYQGRAKSKLDKGERLVIKKQDSAILVHGPDNYQPKNWQPEVDSYTVKADEEELILKAKRTNPDEVVEIRFEEIDLLTVDQLVDESDL